MLLLLSFCGSKILSQAFSSKVLCHRSTTKFNELTCFYRSEQNKYHDLICDFKYFKEREQFDSKLNSSDVRLSYIWLTLFTLTLDSYMNGSP